jgi:hypothetical protein
MVERDMPGRREAWFNVVPEDLPCIVGGIGGTAVTEIPFLQQQTRVIFANLASPSRLRSMSTRQGAGSRDWPRRRVCRRR